MRLTEKQKKELATIQSHIPSNCAWNAITEQDIKIFFEWSERGLHKELAGIKNDFSGFNALCWGKIWRERHEDIKRTFDNI